MKRLHYTAEELMYRPVEHIAEAIVDAGQRLLTCKKVGTYLGIPRSTIHQYCNDILAGETWRWRESKHELLRDPERFRRAIVTYLGEVNV